jgi:MraZ protein
VGVAGSKWVVSPIQHLVFSGAHDLSLDDKNRLSIPAVFRKKFVPERDGTSLFVIEGTDGRLCFYPELYYEALVATEPGEVMPDRDALDYHRTNLGLADQIELDKQGRALIPERALKEAGIGKDVTLVGVHDHMELWNRSEWETERQVLRQRRAETALKRKQTRQIERPTSE